MLRVLTCGLCGIHEEDPHPEPPLLEAEEGRVVHTATTRDLEPIAAPAPLESLPSYHIESTGAYCFMRRGLTVLAAGCHALHEVLHLLPSGQLQATVMSSTFTSCIMVTDFQCFCWLVSRSLSRRWARCADVCRRPNRSSSIQCSSICPLP
jgi:hypothetical protein